MEIQAVDVIEEYRTMLSQAQYDLAVERAKAKHLEAQLAALQGEVTE